MNVMTTAASGAGSGSSSDSSNVGDSGVGCVHGVSVICVHSVGVSTGSGECRAAGSPVTSRSASINAL